MDTLEASPMIATESAIGRIPIFTKPGHTLASKLLLSPKLAPNQARIRQLETKKAPLTKYLKSPFLSPVSCKCPHIIVADDDPFQHLYYQNLFQKSIDFDQVDIHREDLEFELCSSGEDLLTVYNSMLLCECWNLRVVITDYHMGMKKLNGFQTAQKLREDGYKGPILLRTSEKKEDLLKIHPDLENVVTCVIEKADGKAGKEIIVKYLKMKNDIML